MKNSYDIVIVGAGPAGAIAARYAAENGADVLLVDKKKTIGEPVHCGEFIRTPSLSSFLSLEKPWFINFIHGFLIFTPGGSKVMIKAEKAGVMLDRYHFDKELVQQAIQKGIQLSTDAKVMGLIIEDQKIIGVMIKKNNTHIPIKAKIVIAANGPGSELVKQAGFFSGSYKNYLALTAQVKAKNISLECNYCQMHLGQKRAPGGYLWVFPKKNGTTNIGVGISIMGQKKNNPWEYLNKFIQQYYPKASIIERSSSRIPIGMPLKRFVCDGFMTIGDAAFHTNPLTGAGIYTAMAAGKICGKIAANAIQLDDVSAESLIRFEHLWRKQFGTIHHRSLQMRQVLNKIQDNALDKSATSLCSHIKFHSVYDSLMKLGQGAISGL